MRFDVADMPAKIDGRSLGAPIFLRSPRGHYLGIENSPGAQRFPFNDTEDFAFFG